MRARDSKLLFLLLVLGGVAPLAAPRPVHAEDESNDDDEFDTFHVGIRLGAWYRPEIDFNVKVGGDPLPFGGVGIVFPTTLDAERDLAIKGNPKSEYLIDFNESAVLELEPFIQTRFVSVSAQWIAPFEYNGKASLTRTLNFGGVSFSTNQTVESKFRQSFFGADVAINIFNNQYFRISPVVGLRSLWIDWQVKTALTGLGLSGVLKGDTSDLRSPAQVGDWQVFPFPELGFDVAVGYRSIIDVSLKVLGAWVDYFDYQGQWLNVEAAVTVYPISYIGIQLGYRYTTYDFNSRTKKNTERFSFNLDYSGVTFGLIVRI